jgi:hypothetical protein
MYVSRRARGLQGIEAEAGGGRRQECGRIDDCAAIGHLPPQPGLLNDVFGLRATAEHAVRDAEQPASYRDELRRRLLEVSRRGVARSHPAIQAQTACDVPTS